MPPVAHVYPLRVAYHETDAMAVAHHASYVKWFEEARVEWLRAAGLMEHHQPYGPFVFAVVALENRFRKPARFDDELDVWTQARLEGRLRIRFQYALWSKRLQRFIAEGRTELVALTEGFKPTRLPLELCARFEREPWSDVWPPPPASPIRPDAN